MTQSILIIYNNLNKHNKMSKPKSMQSSKKTPTNSLKTQTQSSPQKVSKQLSSMQICAVCLNELDPNYSILNCNHKFCSTQCALGWWKFNSNCPYCRQPIQFIQSSSGQKITFDSISSHSESSSDDDNFIPRCVQCWADIDQNEEKKTCYNCCSRFLHKRCTMFSQRFWKCNDCLENVDDKGREIHPVIPYNPILHFLIINNFKD